MSGCSWNFLLEPFCEMYSVVTVKTVVNLIDANIFLYNKEQNKEPTGCDEITDHFPKNRRSR